MRNALETLPWVEKGTVEPDTARQRVTFAVKDPKEFDLGAVRTAVETRTKFKVGGVLRQDR